MDFYAVLDQVIDLLRSRRRVTYRALKRQFNLDDDFLEDLKEEIIKAQELGCDENNEVLVWADKKPVPKPHAVCDTSAENQFHAALPIVIALLQREGRVSYRTLKDVFGFNDGLLTTIRQELTFKRLAIDEDGAGLVWTGESKGVRPPSVAVPGQLALAETTVVPSPAAPALPALVTDPHARTKKPEVPPDEPVAVLEPTQITSGAERRQLTVMFCDIVGSTNLSRRLDPEDLREVIRAYQACAAEIIHRYEGHIAQYLGDGLLIYFGFPVAHEDDAKRAVYTGLDIPEAIATLNIRLEADYGVQLAVRIGIHTGPVVVGEMGSGGRHENLALGETPNITAHLEGLARPNTVVLSPSTAQLVQRTFVLEELGFHSLKGVAEPMMLFGVVGPRENERDALDAVSFDSLVGRNEEIGLLLRCWEQTKEGLGQVILISGEAGIGKSSLVDGLRAHVRQDGMTCLVFRCSPYHQNSMLYPIIIYLERCLTFQRNDTAETKLDKLEHMLDLYALPFQEEVPLLADLLSVPLPEGRYPALGLTPQQQRQRTHDLLVAWLLIEAKRQPLLILWEDLHWADPTTLEFLESLLAQASTAAMLNVFTFRSEFVLDWPPRSYMIPLTLNRLKRPQVEALVSRLTGGKTLPSEVMSHIVTKADGVPLYVEELTKAVIESDVLHEAEDHYALSGLLSNVAIPVTLNDSLMARLDRVPRARDIAQLGAVIGREFTYETLHALANLEESVLQESLAKLVEYELLYQSGRPPQAKYIFKHALVQDAAYQSLLRRPRRQYHQRMGQLLEARFPETVQTEPEVAAYHYTEAGCYDVALHYWQVAGQRAVQRSAHQEAIAHLSKGLEVLTLLPDLPERAMKELDLQIAIAPAFIATKGSGASEVERTYVRARELCQRIGETPKLFSVLWGLARFYNVRGDGHKAQELGEQLLSLAQRQDDAALLLLACQALGNALYFMGKFLPARTHLEQAKAFDDHKQHRILAVRYGIAPGVQCLAYGAQAMWFLGYPEQARQWAREALTLAQTLEHSHSAAMALYFMARLEILRRDAAAAYEHAEAVIALSMERGFVLWAAMGIFVQGWARVAQGQEQEGVEQMHKGLRATAATGNDVARSLFLGVLADVYHQVGQRDEGWSAVCEALEAMDKSGRRDFEAELYRLQGELLLQQIDADTDQAETCFQRALNVARQQQAKSLELRAAMSFARLWQQQGKGQNAYELLAPVYSWFTEGFDTADLQDAKALLDALSDN